MLTWFAVRTAKARASSRAWIAPMALMPFPPMNTASAASDTCALDQSYISPADTSMNDRAGIMRAHETTENPLA